MMKFLLIHSYSDLNKGDAAIIIATIQNLRKSYPGCRVELQSTYSSEDPCFTDEHLELKKYADAIHTCLFPQLFIKGKNKVKYDTKSKFFSLFKYSFKNLINYISLKLVGYLIWGNKAEHVSINAIKSADVIISKGGSFLCSDGTLRGDIGLFRLLHPFILAKIFNKRTIVFSQSLGPFNSKLSQMIIRRSFKYIDEIFIREHETLKLLEINKVIIPQEKINFCPDIAFSLDSQLGKKIVSVNKDKLNIGITVVDFNFESAEARGKYIYALINMVNEVTKIHNAHFYIFPQVLNKHPEFNTEDMRLAKQIIQAVNNQCITLLEDNYECIDLAETYADMDIFIATRLHSSIFAISKYVPAINIAYHGTKSEGTFKLLNCSEYVFRIDRMDPEALLKSVLELISNRHEISNRLKNSLFNIRNNISKAIDKIVTV